jgi:hypothetical protein
MPKMTPAQEAAYALDFNIARQDLPLAAQLEYDRLIKERVQAKPTAGGQQMAAPPRSYTPDTALQEHSRPPGTARKPPGIVLKTFGGGVGNIILGIALIGGGHSAGAIVFGVLFIILGVTTWILGGFGRKAWDEIPPAGRAIAGTGAVIGMVFLYVLFFWFVILRWVWKYIVDPGLRS